MPSQHIMVEVGHALTGVRSVATGLRRLVPEAGRAIPGVWHAVPEVRGAVPEVGRDVTGLRRVVTGARRVVTAVRHAKIGNGRVVAGVRGVVQEVGGGVTQARGALTELRQPPFDGAFLVVAPVQLLQHGIRPPPPGHPRWYHRPTMDPDLRLAALPSTIYLFSIDRFILLPETNLPLAIVDLRSQGILDAAQAESGYVGVIQRRPKAERAESQFFPVGCLGRIHSQAREDEEYRVTLDGIIRFRVREELAGGDDALPQAAVAYEEFERDLHPQEDEAEGWNPEGFKAAFLQIGQQAAGREATSLESMSPAQLVRFLAQMVPLAAAEKQALLEAPGFRELMVLLFQLLAINYLTTTPDISPSPQAN